MKRLSTQFNLTRIVDSATCYGVKCCQIYYYYYSNQMIWLLYSQPVILRVYMQGTYKIYCNLLWMDLTKDESSQIESRLDEGLSVLSSSANWLPAVLRFKNKEGSVAHALWLPVRWCTFQLLLSWFVHVAIFPFAHAPCLLVC